MSDFQLTHASRLRHEGGAEGNPQSGGILGVGPLHLAYTGAEASVFLNGVVEESDSISTRMTAYLAAVERDPAGRSIPQFSGNYALAIVSNDHQQTDLITDLLASHPIYYARTDIGWVWSFQLRYIIPYLRDRSLDQRGLQEMFLYRWLMEDGTLLAGVKQVLPGHCVTLKPDGSSVVRRYCRFDFAPASDAPKQQVLMSEVDMALDGVLERLRKHHTDICVLFSGGVDSSLLLAKAREHGFRRLFAVTANFPGHDNPELPRAAKIAQHLGVEHRVVDVSDSFVGHHLPDVVWALERPPTYFNALARLRIAAEVSSETDILLSGEVADCLYGGDIGGILSYERKQRHLAALPWPLRHAAAAAFRFVPSHRCTRIANLLDFSTADHIRKGGHFDAAPGSKRVPIGALIPSLRGTLPGGFYSDFEPLNSQSPIAISQNRTLYTSNRNQFQVYNLIAGPAGIQVHFPFAAAEVLASAAKIPDACKWDARGPKPVLKALACKYLPAEWVYESKIGFYAPTVSWLRNAMAGLRGMLTDERTAARGLYDMEVLRRLSPDCDTQLIFTALGVEIFCRQFLDGSIPTSDWTA